MSNSPPSFPDLDDYVAAYEQARGTNASARIEEFIPPENHSLRDSVLRELIRVEMELTRRAGQPRRLLDYLEAYPGLARDRESLQAIAYEEYRQRLLAGEHPTPTEYASRFGIATEGWYVPAASSRRQLNATRIVSHHAQSRCHDDLGGSISLAKQSYPEPGTSVAGFEILE